MIFICKLPINKIKGYLYSILSLSGQSSGSPTGTCFIQKIYSPSGRGEEGAYIFWMKQVHVGSHFRVRQIMVLIKTVSKTKCPLFYIYGWFKDDKYVIWMWIWLIMKNISLLDRIWSLWLVRFAHSPTNFIFWLGRLIFSVSINSHPDNIYLLVRRAKALFCATCRFPHSYLTYMQFAAGIMSYFLFHGIKL
jgi:hypothetical protein